MKKDRFSRSSRERSKELVDVKKIKERLTRKLQKGFQTNYSGLFLMIPFLQNLQLEQKMALLQVENHGIPALENFLYRVQLEMLGRIRSLSCQDPAPAMASGLPANPSDSHLHRFFKRAELPDTDRFIKALGKQQVQTGQIRGSILACDTTLAIYNGQKDIVKDKSGKEKWPQKAVRFYVVVDEGTRNPLYIKAAYPGRRPVEVGKDMVDAAMEILDGKQSTFIYDKWFSVGELLEYMNQRGQKFITLLKRFPNRIRQMNAIALDQFRRYTEYERITHIPVCLRNYSSQARLVVLELCVEGERHLMGYLTNDETAEDYEIADLYPTRWDSEFWIEEMNFMNIKHLPSSELNKISFGLAAKLVAYHVMSAFRGNLGEEYLAYNVGTIYEKFFREQALIRLNNREEIEITIFGHQHAGVLKQMYTNLGEKLQEQGINPGVSWLCNHPLNFVFK